MWMSLPRVFRAAEPAGRMWVLCALLASCPLVAVADEPSLAPVKPSAPVTPAIATPARPPIDPVSHRRMTEAERSKLYDQLEQEVELLERQSSILRKLTRLVRPTVVHIDAKKPSIRPRNGKASEEETGSGVITEVGGRTVVITNRHVINRSALENIRIKLDDGRELQPLRVWSDDGTDIGVLEIRADGLVPARLAREDSIDIGDTVLAIGSPFGLSHSVTMGIVSAKGRRDLELGEGNVKFQDFIQTDAAINPGNSGGPLVNLRGEVVGINTAIASNSGGSEGIGFAIPVGMAVFVARQLVETGSVARAYLGVALDRNFTQPTAERLGMVRAVGARVSGVTEGTPAAAAGILADDVILEFNGRLIDDDDHLVSMVSVTPVNRTVELVIFRNRERVTLDLPVASRAQFEPSQPQP
jgi:serine protease Do